MDLKAFQSLTVKAGDKGRFLNAFNQMGAGRQQAAYFVDSEGVAYTATAGDSSPYGAVFKLCGAGIKKFKAFTNYEVTSEHELGILKLHGATTETVEVTMAKSHSMPQKKFMTVSLDEVPAKLRELYKRPGASQPIVGDIQSETASVKTEKGRYKSAGMRNVHRLYMATAFTILRNGHTVGSRDAVVALLVDSGGRIISWGRKNPDVPMWHGETSAVMANGGKVPAGSCVYSTLKPCAMCAGLIYDRSGGKVKVFYGQDDPGSAAQGTALDTAHLGALLDGDKTHVGARAIFYSGRGGDHTPMATELGEDFTAQKGSKGGKKSTIDYITTPAARDLVLGAETMLKNKYDKYAGRDTPRYINDNTAFVVRYLVDYLSTIGIRPEGIGA